MITDIFTKWLELDAKLRIWHSKKNIHYKAILGLIYFVVNTFLFVLVIGSGTLLIMSPFLLVEMVLIASGFSLAASETAGCIAFWFVIAYVIALMRNL